MKITVQDRIVAQDRVLIIGGHLTPALAVLEELQKQGFTDIYWAGVRYSQTAGRNESAEYGLIKDKGIPFLDFRAGKLWRKWTLKTLFKGIYNLVLIPWGWLQALYILIKYKPKLILSFGGYMAVPFVMAAWLLGIKTATHEQVVAMGLSNRIITRFVNRIYLSWQENLQELSPKLQAKALVTGNPIRKSLLEVTTSAINFPDPLPLVYVTGGNQGANTINWRLFKILPELLKEVNLVHQVGASTITNDIKEAARISAELPPELSRRYLYFDNIFGPEIAEIYNKADLIVSRAGANTISELMLLGKLAILIPIPWSAHQEQKRNAELYAKTGLGLVLEQYDAMPPEELLAAIRKGLEHVSKQTDFTDSPLQESSKQAQKSFPRDAAENIVADIMN